MNRKTTEELMMDCQAEAYEAIHSQIKGYFYHQDHEMIGKLTEIVIEGICDKSEHALNFAKFLSMMEILALQEDVEKFESTYAKDDYQRFVDSV